MNIETLYKIDPTFKTTTYIHYLYNEIERLCKIIDPDMETEKYSRFLWRTFEEKHNI